MLSQVISLIVVQAEVIFRRLYVNVMRHRFRRWYRSLIPIPGARSVLRAVEEVHGVIEHVVVLLLSTNRLLVLLVLLSVSESTESHGDAAVLARTSASWR